MITVKNLRGKVPLGENDYYVGRYCKWRPELIPSMLANPFPVVGKRTREMSLTLYREWINQRIEESDGFSPYMDELSFLISKAEQGDISLCCWCSPLGCHADILKEIIESYV